MEELDFPELDSIRIPDKTHFKIGEVAKLLDLEPYVLRYWEKEFDVLEPDKTDSGQRAYQRDDIRLLATIQKLLYTEMFTIDGARRQLELAQQGEPSYLTSTLGEDDEQVGASPEELEEVRRENEQLRAKLEQANERQVDQREQFQERVETLEARLETAREETGADPERVRELRAEADELDDQNDTLRRQLADARRRIEKLEAENQRLEESTPGLDADSREVVEALTSQVDALADLAR